MTDPVFLSIEPPLPLSPSAKRRLEQARRKARDGQADEDVTKLDVLERAWIDEEYSIQ